MIVYLARDIPAFVMYWSMENPTYRVYRLYDMKIEDCKHKTEVPCIHLAGSLPVIRVLSHSATKKDQIQT